MCLRSYPHHVCDAAFPFAALQRVPSRRLCWNVYAELWILCTPPYPVPFTPHNSANSGQCFPRKDTTELLCKMNRYWIASLLFKSSISWSDLTCPPCLDYTQPHHAWLCVVLGSEPSASHMLGKHSVELSSQPSPFVFSLSSEVRSLPLALISLQHGISSNLY